MKTLNLKQISQREKSMQTFPACRVKFGLNLALVNDALDSDCAAN